MCENEHCNCDPCTCDPCECGQGVFENLLEPYNMVHSDSYFDDTSMVEVAGNRIVWKHIQEQNRLMTLDPLGYDAIKDIDELHSRNRRKSDDPYIRATSEKMAHYFPKIEDAERR